MRVALYLGRGHLGEITKEINSNLQESKDPVEVVDDLALCFFNNET